MIGPRYTPELIDEYTKKGYWDSNLMADDVDENGRKYADKEALVDAQQRLTWAEVSRKSDQLALGLIELGFKPDDVILVQVPNSVELFLLVIAGEKAGITIVTAQPTFRHQEINALLQHVEAKGIVIPWVFRGFDYHDMLMDFRPQLTKLEHTIIVGDEMPDGTISFEGIIRQGAESKLTRDYLQQTKFKPYDITRVVTTSGTTGIPKCAGWETIALRHAAKVLARRWGLGPDDIVGAFYQIIGGGLSIFSLYGVPFIGAKIVLLDRYTPQSFCELVQKEKITLAGIVPAEVARLLEHPDLNKYDFSSLRLLAHSTTLLPYELAVRAEETLGCRYVQTYGTMDSGPISCITINESREIRVGTVGKPYDGNEVKIVDDEGNQMPQGETGEVLIKGPTSGSGYYKNPELIAQTWKEGWFDTTNQGSLDKDGNIIIMGRRRDVIIRGGQNIYPKEIEDLLAQHPKISEVSVVRMPDRILGERACAFVVPRRGQQITFEELTEFLNANRLAPFKLPERLEVRDELPLVPAGQKVDVIQLEKEIADTLEKEQK
ncbi:AMP-binding protein [Chloroflexota bacterium]